MAVGSDEGLALRSATGRVALVATVAASAMASLDATVVNVALPHIGKDFHASVSSLQWVLTGYLLALASLILLGGALGDRIGRRRVFVIGTAWFAVASLLCGVAPNIGTLIAARFLEGVGGALLTPGSLAIIQASYRRPDRAAAVGAWSGLGAAAGAIGPLLGGALVDGPGWRWAFLINLPVAGVAIACAMVAVPETKDPNATRALDVRGAALAAAALAAGTWALTEAGRRGWGDPLVVAAGVVALACAAAFVRHILRSPGPLVPPALFRDRTFTVVNLGTALLYGAVGLTFFLVAYELEVAAGWSALQAGAALLPTTLLMLLLSERSGALATRIGPRVQLTVGPLLTAAGLLLLLRLGPHTTWLTDVLPGSIVLGLGLVTFVAPLTATVMAAADPNHVSIASGVNNAIARTASLTALAMVPVVAGLTTASGPAEVTHAVRIAIVISAALAASAGVLMYVGLAPHPRSAWSPRRVHCAVDGPPLQPDPGKCPVPPAVPDSAHAS
jgi:EmrB/QacA subfamily drug resistance transporter